MDVKYAAAVGEACTDSENDETETSNATGSSHETITIKNLRTNLFGFSHQKEESAKSTKILISSRQEPDS
jgi:hypothetical protein